MQVSYHKDNDNAYQKVMIEINKSPDDIFKYLGTTEGIQQWFPELSFRGTKQLIFDLGNDEFEEITVLRYENPNFIHFTWDGGEVEILLEDVSEVTILTLNERLPFTFENIHQDFTGWQFQVENIKHISEHGEPISMEKQAFEAIQKKVQDNLKL